MYLYGAGGHAKVIMDILKENSTELTGIIDDNPHIQEWMEYHVLSYDPKRMFPILISIGNNSIRKNIAEQLYKKNAVFGTVISIHAIVSPYAKIGEGSSSTEVARTIFPMGVIRKLSGKKFPRQSFRSFMVLNLMILNIFPFFPGRS